MPNVRNEVRDLADVMRAKFTPPDFVPGCLVKSVADKDEYTTNNGWVEAIVGPHGQQRVRYYGEPPGLAVDTSYIDVEYFPAYRLYRVFSLGGGTAHIGGVKVSEIWESDLGGTALSADASGNLTINGTRTLTIPTDLIHAGDTDTLLSFAADQLSGTIGGLLMLRLTETTQDLVELGDVAGGGDVDINFNAGQAFLEGSSGKLAIGTTTTDGLLTLVSTSAIGDVITYSGTSTGAIMDISGASEPSASFGLVQYNTDIQPQVAGLTISTYSLNPAIGGSSSNAVTSFNHYTLTGRFADSYGGTVSNLRRFFLLDWADNSSGSPAVTNQYGIQINELTFATNNWAIYTRDSTRSYFGATAAGVAAEGKLHIKQGETGDAIPVLFLDQLDVSEPAIIISYNSTDQDMIAIELDVTGTPQFGWDESETAFSLSDSLHFLDGHVEFVEITAPAAGAANSARLFAQDNGAGKTQLAVRFNTGAIQVLATEP